MTVRREHFRSAWVLSTLLAAPLTGQAGDWLYVENSKSGDLTILDIASNKVLGKLDVVADLKGKGDFYFEGSVIDDVLGPSSGDVLYVSRPAGRDIVAIDPGTGKILWRVGTRGTPDHLALSPDGRRLFVALFNDYFVDVIDTEKRALAGQVRTGYGSHGIRVSDDGTTLYVGQVLHQQLTIADAHSLKVIKNIQFNEGVRPFDITADGKTAYVQLSRLHGFDVVDLDEGLVRQTVYLPPLPVGVRPMQEFPHTADHGLKITPDKKSLLAAATLADYVAVYSLPDLRLQRTIPTGDEPNWITFDREGKNAYVTNRGSNDLSIISLKDWSEVARVKVNGNYPQRAWPVPAPKNSPFATTHP